MFFMFLGHNCLHQLPITHTLALFSHVTFVFILSSTHLLSFSRVSFVFILLIHTCMQSYIPTSYYHIFSNILFLIFFFPLSCARAHTRTCTSHTYMMIILWQSVILFQRSVALLNYMVTHKQMLRNDFTVVLSLQLLHHWWTCVNSRLLNPFFFVGTLIATCPRAVAIWCIC